MAHIIVIGCGNIGSHLVPHLARLPKVDKVTLIDRDQYEHKNLASQAIDRCDIGRHKAQVQAARMRRINPSLQIRVIDVPVETVPLAVLRGDLILSCLDSRAARLHTNQCSFRLGVPWIDAGVEPNGMLVRLSAFRPAEHQPCFECGWSDQDYQALETTYPCWNGETSAPATNGPSALGALAASLQAIEAEKYLSGRADLDCFGRQLLVAAANHKQYFTTLGRNPRCRFDHEVWRIEKLNLRGRKPSLADVLGISTQGSAEHSGAWLRVERKPFAQKLFCPSCGHTRTILHLLCSLPAKVKTCSLCGDCMQVAGWDLVESLTSHLPRKTLARSLRSLGLRLGDVITTGGSLGERHLEVTADAGTKIDVAA